MKIKLFIIALLFIPVASFAADSVTIGTLTLTPTFENVGVVCEYSDDDNSNMTAVVEYQADGAGSWTTAHTPYIDRRSVVEHSGGTTANPKQYEIRTAVFELSRNTTYNVRVTFTDTDGVSGTNPTSESATTWSHDQRTYNGTTRTVCSSGCDDTSINDGISAASTNDIIQVKTGSYSGFTLSKSGIKIEAFDDNNMPSITSNSSISGDNNEIDHLNFTGGDLTLSSGATYNVIRYSTFDDNGGDYAAIDLETSGSIDGTLIEYNHIDMSGESQGSEASTGIYFNGVNASSLGATVFRYNTFDGCWDAIGGSQNIQVNAGPGDNSDFYGNTINDADDDGFEIEGRVINIKVYNNIINDTSNDDMGLAPVSVGPIFIFNNVFNSTGGYSYKLGNGPSTGPIYTYYNTFRDAVNIMSLAGGSSTDNITAYCNIMDKAGTGQYVYDRVGDTTIQSDYNLYYLPGGSYAKLDSTSTVSISQWRDYTNSNNDYGEQDTNTFTGTIGWTDESGGNFTLQSNSEAIGACGVTINGITKDITGGTRSAPYDIGAYEYEYDTGEAPANSIQGVSISELKVTDNLTAWNRTDGLR